MDLVQQMRTDVERLQSEAMSKEESLSELEKTPGDEERDACPYSLDLADAGVGDVRVSASAPIRLQG